MTKGSLNPSTAEPSEPKVETTEMTTVPKILLTIDEARRMLRIGRTTLYELFNAGEITSITIGTRRLVPVEEIHNYLSKKVAEATAELATA